MSIFVAMVSAFLALFLQIPPRTRIEPVLLLTRLVVLVPVFVIASPKEVMFSSAFVCLFVYLLAKLRKNYSTDFSQNWVEKWPWVKEETFRFWR